MPSTHPPEDKQSGSTPNGLPALQPGASAATKSNAIEIPQITLPKGGGALKGIDEKFEVNAANGTASYSIPLPLSPGRNGFQPALALSYNSGAGNGLFGLGWDLSFPSIQRKTDKRLPRYRDYEDSDTFMFTGVEDLVPALKKNENGGWDKDEFEKGDYTIRRYRPRTEGAFSRIERIWKKGEPVFYWKVTTRDNVATFFGKSETHRIADPADKSRVFQWLPELSLDDKGNCMLFEFKAEDHENAADGPHEFNRRNDGPARFVNRHLKQVFYTNRSPFFPDYTQADNLYQTTNPAPADFLFHLVFDYGEHGTPLTDTQGTAVVTYQEAAKWPARHDAFSNYRPGFEMRSYRLCRRVLMFHYFPELGDAHCLVRSLDLYYRNRSEHPATEGEKLEVTYLNKVIQRGYVRAPGASTGYRHKSLPPLEFHYQELRWDTAVKDVQAKQAANAPAGLGSGYQWTDFYGEGIAGIFAEQAGGWYYKENLGNGEFTPARAVAPKPSFTGLSGGVLQLQDLEADGRKQIVVNSPGLQGYFELTDENDWEPFRAFARAANVDLRDPNIRLLDLNGDGQPEIVLSEERAFTWYPAAGTQGYDAPELAPKPFDEERGPALVFAEPLQTIFLADMSGDGLTDLVRIRNGEVCYWPNLGYGRFGAKVTMSHAPLFDTPDQFNPAYIHLADVSGTGATDLLYLGQDRFRAWLNLSGNGWSAPVEIDPFPQTAPPGKLDVVDFFGQGTSCIVWSSPLPGQPPLRYIDLMGGVKPHIMTEQHNGMGKVTRVTYKSSTHFYLEDKKAGKPWMTKLPFPVQCVAKVEVTEAVTQVRFVSEYTYHHGYYDHPEREFRGFGRVEQTDTEFFEDFEKTAASNVAVKELYQPPVLTKTWYHTGAFLCKERLLTHFKKEYWHEEFRKMGFDANPVEYELQDAVLLAADSLGDFDVQTLSAETWREALRACKGMVLRQEVFGLDATDEQDVEQMKKQATPYSVATHNCEIQLLQKRGNNRYAVFIVKESQSVTYHYERNPEDPRIAHTLNLETDELGNVLEAVSIVYPRIGTEALLQDAPTDTLATRKAKAKGREDQKKGWITFTKNEFTNDLAEDAVYRLRQGWQTRSYELTGFKTQGALFALGDFKGGFNDWNPVEYHRQTSGIAPEKRLIEHVKTKFYSEDLQTPLPDGQLAANGLLFENYQLAYTPNLLQDIFAPSAFSVQFDVTEDDMRTGGFYEDDTNWWIRSGTVRFLRAGEKAPAASSRFFVPVAYTDPFEKRTEVYYDAHHLFMQRAVDVLGNETSVTAFNYRTLSPVKMRDLNDNLSSVVLDELGLVKAAAAEGKDRNGDGTGEEGDNLNGFGEATEGDEQDHIAAFFQTAQAPGVCNSTQLQSIARDLLRNAGARMVYDFSQQPTVVASIVREEHAAKNPNSPLQISFEYSDGLGKVAMKKVQAEPGEVVLPDGSPLDTSNQIRWVGNGRTVLNNKGNPIKQYEPYFSTTPAYEDDPAWVERGVTPILYYDSAGRNIKTELPDGAFTKVVFDAWKQYAYDPNDTVKDSAWYARRLALADNNPDKKAARKTELHHDTPTCLILDTLGRPTLGIDHNRFEDGAGNIREEFYHTHIALDIEGNQTAVTDARGNTVMQYRHDLLGRQVAQTSMDAGRRWMLNNALGNPVKTWDERAHEFSFEYDALHRPTAKRVSGGDGSLPLNCLYERILYGENQPDAKRDNLRGKAAALYDTAGRVVSERYDFKGNLLSSTRTFAKDYKNTPDWDTPAPGSLLEGAKYTFTTLTEYDALNRPVRLTTPDKKVTRNYFNPAGLLERVTLDGAEYVKNINYDANGQRERIQYGNGVSTKYEYDPETFRLTQLRTTRTGGEVLQLLEYTYDPGGNITQIKDAAIPVVFFNNRKIAGKNEYTYDALYRLIAATGREQNTNAPNFGADDNWNDAHARFAHYPGDPMAMRLYTQRYQYDAVGNIQQMRHEAGPDGSWTRDYAYESKNNRLRSTTIGSQTYLYPHHPQHGYMTAMPHLQRMAWTFKEELAATAKQSVHTGTPETTWYVYDGTGQRARKITEYAAAPGSAPAFKDERVYIGGYEVYRHENGLERETLHIMDDQKRIAMLDTETEPRRFLGLTVGRTTPLHTTRYQMGNHLGSTSLELDETAAVISYEEYHPYGTTAYQARNAAMQAAAKRYRYTGMERDEETGLEYHSARYYVVWLGRWGSCDPIGVEDGINAYCMVMDNPIINFDLNGQSTKGAIRTIATHRKHEYSLYDELGNRISEDEHVLPKSSQKAVTFNPETGKSDYQEAHYQNNTTVRGENTFADEKTRGGPTSDNARSSRLNKKAKSGISIDVNRELFVDSLENAKRARTITGSVLTDDDLHKTALAEMGELFEIHGHKGRKKVELTWERISDADLKKEQESLIRAQEAVEKSKQAKLIKTGGEVIETSTKTTKALTKLAKAGRHFLAAVPIVGSIIGHTSTVHAAATGDVTGAALDVAGHIPVAGDLLDAGRGGYALGEAVNELLPLEEAAMQAGDATEKVAKSLGLSEDTSRVLGGVGAALGAINAAASYVNPLHNSHRVLRLFR